MNKTLLPVFVIIFCACVQPSTAQQTLFSEVLYVDFDQTSGTSCVQTPEGNYMVAGYTGAGALAFMLDTSGTLTWSRAYGNHNNERFNNVILTSDSGFVFAGTAYNPNSASTEMTCIKLNRNLDTVWSRQCYSGTTHEAFSVVETFDHGFALAGYTTVNGTPNSNISVVKLDSAGNQEWSTYITTANFANCGYSIRQLPDSGYVICGFGETSGPFTVHAAVVKIDQAGNVIWTNWYASANPDQFIASDVCTTSDGLMIFLSGQSKLVLMKTDFSGNVLWSRNYLTGNGIGCTNCVHPKVHQTSDGGYIFVSGFGDMFGWGRQVLKVDSAGHVDWSQDDFLNALEGIQTIDGGYFILGNGPFIGVQPHSTKVPFPQIGVIKSDSLGNGVDCTQSYPYANDTDTMIVTSIAATQTAGGTTSAMQPAIWTVQFTVDSGCVDFLGAVDELRFHEIQIYPNPTSSAFTVENLDGDFTTLTIFNTVGQVVFEKPVSGKKEITIAHGLSKGIYFVQVKNDSENYTVKLIVE